MQRNCQRGHLFRSCLLLGFALGSLPANAATAAKTDEPIEALLERQTQELLDAVAPGHVEVWERLLHPDVIYVSENGEVFHKPQLLAQITPMPAGMSGTLHVGKFTVARHGDVAIA